MTAVEAHVHIDGLSSAIATVIEQSVLRKCAHPDHSPMSTAAAMTVAFVEYGQTVAGPSCACGCGEAGKSHDAA